MKVSSGEPRTINPEDLELAISTALIRGSAQLILDCVSGITTAAERLHQTIAGTSTIWLGGISRFRPLQEIKSPVAYAAVRAASDSLNKGLTTSLAHIHNHSDLRSLESGEIRWVAMLNGICGDHLEDTGNVLAIPMEFIVPPESLRVGTKEASPASPHIVVLLHGLCLSEQSWQRDENPGMGEHLKQELGMSPVYLRYNTGRRVSANGKELADRLDDLIAGWPVPVESLSLIGYSMGGLVIRSACWYADSEQRSWIKPLKRILFLGTPHHGSPIENAGHLVDRAMQSVKYVEPLAFGRKRSAGIKDLREGDFLGDEWDRRGCEKSVPDSHSYCPLLPLVDYYFVAASIGHHEEDPLGYIFGDLLVRVSSALGAGLNSPGDPEVKKENCRIFQERNHFDLVHDDRIIKQVIDWFKKPSTH